MSALGHLKLPDQLRNPLVAAAEKGAREGLEKEKDETKRQMMEIADGYDRMAERAEKLAAEAEYLRKRPGGTSTVYDEAWRLALR